MDEAYPWIPVWDCHSLRLAAGCSSPVRCSHQQLSLTACERNFMKVSLLALLGLFVLVDASTLLRAQQSEKRTWRLTVEQGEPRLEYGTDNPEDTPIAFSCKPGRGPVDVWINETGKGVNANRSMVASLTAGRTTSKVRGKTLTNEEAGSPSFQGTLPASDPLFATLSKERTLGSRGSYCATRFRFETLATRRIGSVDCVRRSETLCVGSTPESCRTTAMQKSTPRQAG